jgi:hypothetical protein
MEGCTVIENSEAALFNDVRTPFRKKLKMPSVIFIMAYWPPVSAKSADKYYPKTN